MKILFLDESGDHNLNVIDPQYPIFVLGGVIVDADYLERVMVPRVRQFKLDLFGREDLNLHTAAIVRNKDGFEGLKDVAFRNQFFASLNDLMRTLEYKVVACAIKKFVHLDKYGHTAVDPYMLSMDVLIERFWFEVGDRESGGVVAERRGGILDQELNLSWSSLQIRGTRYIQASRLRRRIDRLELRPKSDDVAGLQLADLVVSPIGRFVLGKPQREDFRIIEAKFRRRSEDYRGCGLVILPKE